MDNLCVYNDNKISFIFLDDQHSYENVYLVSVIKIYILSHVMFSPFSFFNIYSSYDITVNDQLLHIEIENEKDPLHVYCYTST